MDGRVEGEEVKVTLDRRLFEVGGEGNAVCLEPDMLARKWEI